MFGMNWISNAPIGGIKNQIDRIVVKIWDDKVNTVEIGR